MKQRNKVLLGPLAALVLIAGAASQSTASPFGARGMEDAVFRGPTHSHATSIFTNPAALGDGIRANNLYLGIEYEYLHLAVDRQTVVLSNCQEANGCLETGPTVQSRPQQKGGLLAFLWKFQKASLGIGALMPTEETIPDNEALAYHAFGGRMRSYGASLAISYRGGDFFFGLGIAYWGSSLSYRFKRDLAMEAGQDGIRGDCGGAPCGYENPERSSVYKIDLHTSGLRPFDSRILGTENLSLNVGVLYRVLPNWRIAFSYQSPPGNSLPLLVSTSERKLEGDVKISGAQTGTGKAEVSFSLPHTLTFGVRGEVLPGYDFVGTLSWKNLHVHKQMNFTFYGQGLEALHIPEWYPRHRGFEDVWKVLVGLERSDTERLRLGARFIFETATVKSENLNPLQVFGANFGIALGLEYRFGDNLSINGDYRFTYYPDQNSEYNVFDPREYVRCVDSGYNVNDCESVRAGTAFPTAAGRYRKSVHSSGVSVRYYFL